MSDVTDLFPGFESHWIDTDAGRIFARSGGSGPPLLLLHGFPQSHVMWHRVAPALASRFTVVAMDLRGYGWSSAPSSEGGVAYTKREMGKDVVAVMLALGHVRFGICGHDRGARVGYRLALDHPGHVESLALLDILPFTIVWENIRAGSIPANHWAFLAKPAPEPETAILRAPDQFLEGLMATWTRDQSIGAFDARALAMYRAAWGDPSRIHAMCEDYRAGADDGLDLQADRLDLSNERKILCPVNLLVGDYYLMRDRTRTPLQAWRETFAPQAISRAIDGGHFLAEENPDATARALLDML